MNFIVSSSSLLKQLQKIGGVLNSSNTLPILDNFLFEISGNQLKVSASDLETTMTTKLSIESSSDGRIAIPARLLLDTLKNFPDQPLRFLIKPEEHTIEISSDYGKYKLSGYSADEFPSFPVVDQPAKFSVQAGVLSKAIQKTLFAAGNDDLRPVMSGVYCELNSDNVTFVATDAHKLVRYKRKDLTSEVGAAFIMPNKPLNLLKGNIPSNEDVVEIEFNQTNAHFKFDNTELICRLVEGKYPNYEAVIPKDNPNILTIEKSLFLSSIKRVSIFANKTTHQVKFKLAGSLLKISAEDLDFANEANESLKCNYQGDDLEIAFNSKFLIEILNNIDSDEIQLAMSEPSRAGIITPSSMDGEKEDVLMLVMPIMLN